MKLKEFLEKFLPDYQEKIKDVTGRVDITAKGFRCLHFQESRFPEALQNFADQICEKQRENCTSEKCVIDGEYDENLIKCAKQPKINEI